MLTKDTNNITFLANTPVAQRLCACGKVRSASARAEIAWLGCNVSRRVGCQACGCQVDALGGGQARIQTTAAAGENGREGLYCSLCGGDAQTSIHQCRHGIDESIPACITCATTFRVAEF